LLLKYLIESCNPEYPVPIIHIHGLNDTRVPYEGTGYSPSVDSTIAIWRGINNCYSNSYTIYDVNGILGRQWDSIDGNGDIILYTIEGWGHEWPQDEAGIEATDVIWDFLEQQRRVIDTDSNDWFVFCFEADEEIISTPAIDNDGTIYFVTKQGKLYAVQTSANGLCSDAPWPTFRHDTRNTGNAGRTLP
jgi:hypothetical protein